MNNSLSRKDYIILFFVFPALFFIAFFQTRGIIPPYFSPTNGIIVWPLRLAIVYIGIKCFIRNGKRNQIVLTFIIYSLFTVISYLINGFPLSLYITSCITFLIPVLFVFVGMETNSNYYNWFYKSFYWACVACCGIGLILFFMRPEWYNSAIITMYNENSQEVQSAEKILEWYRFSSYLSDSYDISYITMASLPIGLFLSVNEKNKKKVLWYIVATGIIYFSSLLCQQRAAMFCTTLVLLVFLFKRNRKSFWGILFFGGFLLTVIVVLMNYMGDNEIISMITARFGEMSYSETVGTRTNQTLRVLAAWRNYLLGEGIGSGSGFAVKQGMVGISDGAFIQILYELGLLGSLLFLSIFIRVLRKGWKHQNYLFVELSIIVSFLITMTGAGPFVYFFYMIPFWFAVGRIMNNSYLDYLKMNHYSL